MKVLHLTLKKKWFDMIASGEKLEEYREIKPYWQNRLCDKHKGNIGGEFMNEHKVIAYTFRQFDTVCFTNGYAKGSRKIHIEWEGIGRNTGNPDWGAEPGKEYFVIKLGKIIQP